MLRFINLSDQINEGEKEFAFYDIITESFVTFSGSQTWASVDDFTKDYQNEQGSKHNYARMVRLIPNVSETTMEYLIPTIFIDDDDLSGIGKYIQENW